MDKIKSPSNLQLNHSNDDHLRIYEPEWMSTDLHSMNITPVTGYSPTIDVPLLQVYSFLSFYLILIIIIILSSYLFLFL